ncbi:hypothetical protein GGTG_03116 [Gaeumannomyces tritici R3-111a-1]|uniref:Alpha/beta hydrolase fold-3 domain-containing protein n=1 Tax=Gaeumannomyces tritici (strain R3-111a-1) TaxID=644352 RepID=J3NPA8_GAET3|nr:hypothetical protein GGTG_03116 [Gaeumannomyces tritici R3-111a-1]EJT78013.1 hypothetical protein GGTG_03116 [Gaeumannomyces tritici R3-111a-1]
MTRLLRAGVDAQSTVAATTAVSLEPGPEGDRFCAFGPFEDAVYVGPLSPRAATAGSPDAAAAAAAAVDVLTSYLYLTRSLSIPAENMVMSGDSAGGNLCMGLLRYIARYGDSLGIPAPGSCVLVSPWVDPWPETAGPHVQPYLSHRNYNIDYIDPLGLEREFRDNAYMTPAGKPFATCVPMFASFGDSEVLGDDVEEWAAGMSAVEGNVVETFVEKDGVHDILVFGDALGFEDAANDVAQTKVTTKTPL